MLSGVGCQQSNKTKGLIHLTLNCPLDQSEFSLSAHILPKLTAPLPSMNFEKTSWPHLYGLKLADEDYKTPGPIDVILGADVYYQIIEDGLIKGDEKSPIAQLTKFGWIISGPVPIQSSSTTRQAYHILPSIESSMIYYSNFGNSKKSRLHHHLYQLMIKNVNSILKYLTHAIKQVDI